ncbi:MAG: SIMPL domain-containing protein [Caulobacteraceae bacterium]
MKPTPLAAVAACTLALASAPAWAAEDAAFAATTLNLSAAGQSHAAPDMASVTLGVQVQAPTAEQAMAINAQRMTAVIAALRRAGVAERDIRTSSLNLQAQYAFPQNQARQLTGYEATNGVSVEARDLARLGALLDAAVAAGANQVNGISFGLKDPHAAEDAARLDAVKALQAKADLYAKATGYRVGRLVNLSEGGGYEPSPPRPLATMAARSFAATPVEAGTLDVRIEVSGTFELSR